MDCIVELVLEGALGDMWGKVKGGVKQATQFVANKGIEMFLGLLKKITTPQDLQGIEQLQDPAKLKQYAAKGMQSLNAAGGGDQAQPAATNNESVVYSNKRLFAAAILAENNLLEMVEKYSFITEHILSEAKGKVGATQAGSNSSYWDTTTAAKNQKAQATARKRKEAGQKGQAKAPYGGKATAAAPAAQSIASNAPAAAAPAAAPAANPGLEQKLTAKAREIKGQQQPRGAGKLNTYVKQVADELRKRYSKSPSQLQDGLRSFNQQLTSALGQKQGGNAAGSPAKGAIGSLPKAPAGAAGANKVQPPTYPPSGNTAGAATGSTTPAAGAAATPAAGGAGTPPAGGAAATPAAGGAGTPPAGGAAATPAAGGGAAPATNVSAPATKQKEGLIRKAINWVKANPKRTAGTILGIIAVIALAVGGWAVLAPMLAKYGFLSGAVKGALIGGAKNAAQNIAKQGFSNNEFSGKELAKQTGKGAAIGGAIGGMMGAAAGGGDNGDDSYTNTDHDNDGTTQFKQGGGFRPPEPDEMEPDETPQVDEDEFAKFNVPQHGSPAEQAASGFDPNSPMDQAKKMIMQKLKDGNNGQIPASKYNAAAAKVSGLLKKGMKPDQIAAQLVADSVSYTTGYLEYF
jgi:hypothetical protein